MQPIRCFLTEVTQAGGCLIVDLQTIVPERFALYHSFRTKRGCPCRVKWRNAGLIGFEFVKTKGEVGATRQSRWGEQRTWRGQTKIDLNGTKQSKSCVRFLVANGGKAENI
jgi:hypothetical protein